MADANRTLLQFPLPRAQAALSTPDALAYQLMRNAFATWLAESPDHRSDLVARRVWQRSIDSTLSSGFKGTP